MYSKAIKTAVPNTMTGRMVKEKISIEGKW
jgi:hypothetical protein